MISALSSVRWVELLGLIWFTELMKEFDDLSIPCEPHIAVKIHGLLGEKESHGFLYAFSDANTTAYRDLGIVHDSSMQNLYEH